MDKDYVRGFKEGLGILSVFLLVFSVYAVGFHPSSEVVPGTFDGDYSFNGTVDVSGKVGIGTSSPQTKLDVDGEIRSTKINATDSIYLPVK